MSYPKYPPYNKTPPKQQPYCQAVCDIKIVKGEYGDSPHTVKLDASSSYILGNGKIDKYEWDMGDGTTKSGKTISHTYKSDYDKNYNVTLKVKDNYGKYSQNKCVKIIQVKKKPEKNKKPICEMMANPKTGDAPLQVNFNGGGSYDPDGNIITYDWKMGDGHQRLGEDVSYTYNTPGTYTANLVVFDNKGERSANVCKTTIKVKEKKIEKNKPPICEMDVSPKSGKEPLQVHFDGGTSYDIDGNIEKFEWRLGDGEERSSEDFSYTYDNPGTYTASLVVYDDKGERSKNTCRTTIKVEKQKEEKIVKDKDPVCVIDIIKVSGRKIEVSGKKSYDPDGDDDDLEYDWDFGDNEGSDDKEADHKYDKDDTYTIKLTVEDESGNESDTCKAKVKVEEQKEKVVKIVQEEGKVKGIYDSREPITPATGSNPLILGAAVLLAGLLVKLVANKIYYNNLLRSSFNI